MQVLVIFCSRWARSKTVFLGVPRPIPLIAPAIRRLLSIFWRQRRPVWISRSIADAGAGNSRFLLAERFAKVVATDASASQIENAALHAKVDIGLLRLNEAVFRTLRSISSRRHKRRIGLTFHSSTLRLGGVARPHAAIALISYGVLHVEVEPNAIAQRFYREVIGPYWPPERRHVESAYRSLDFPFEEIETPPLSVETSWRLFDLIGYIDTWSAELEKRLGRGPVEHFQDWREAGAIRRCVVAYAGRWLCAGHRLKRRIREPIRSRFEVSWLRARRQRSVRRLITR